MPVHGCSAPSGEEGGEGCQDGEHGHACASMACCVLAGLTRKVQPKEGGGRGHSLSLTWAPHAWRGVWETSARVCGGGGDAWMHLDAPSLPIN
jgi:hypothetical protein